MSKSSLLLSVIGLLFISCAQNNNSQKLDSIPDQSTAYQNKLKDTVLLEASLYTLKLNAIPDTLNLKMINHTNDTLTTGLHYKIQRFHNNHWNDIVPDQPFQDIGFRLLPMESKSFTVKMMKDKLTYRPGVYRIAKYYLKMDYMKTHKQFTTYTELIIE